MTDAAGGIGGFYQLFPSDCGKGDVNLLFRKFAPGNAIRAKLWTFIA
jgi:hypothetical protein